MRRSSRVALLALLVVLGALASGCGGRNLAHFGYAGNKVWYIWQGSRYTIVVCDVEPDGGETNCRESDI